jgi:hypothetical protein
MLDTLALLQGLQASWDPTNEETYILAGDEVVITKAGKQTYGLDRFYSSLYDKAVPG